MLCSSNEQFPRYFRDMNTLLIVIGELLCCFHRKWFIDNVTYLTCFILPEIYLSGVSAPEASKQYFVG